MENRFVIISDVDGTLLGDDRGLEEFASWCESRRDHLRLVYNSGRLFDSVMESVATTALPIPDAVIGGVGTQIRTLPCETPLPGWLEDTPGWYPVRIMSALAEVEHLELQPEEFLAPHKISYFARNFPPGRIQEIERRLDAADCRVDLIYSSHRDLDVLPRGVNKGTAAAFLAEQWRVPVDRVVVSGDSGNDLAMFQHAFRGIVVGNAHPELRSLNSPCVYQAQHTHAAGVLEGLDFWRI